MLAVAVAVKIRLFLMAVVLVVQAAVVLVDQHLSQPELLELQIQAVAEAVELMMGLVVMVAQA